MNKLVNVTFEEMKEFLTNPDSRIIDSRMLEIGFEFEYSLQVLRTDDTIWQTSVRAQFVDDAEGTRILNADKYRRDVIDLFKLQYANSPRQNPALYGLLDAEDAESRVEQTLPIQTR